MGGRVDKLSGYDCCVADCGQLNASEYPLGVAVGSVASLPPFLLGVVVRGNLSFGTHQAIGVALRVTSISRIAGEIEIGALSSRAHLEGKKAMQQEVNSTQLRAGSLAVPERSLPRLPGANISHDETLQMSLAAAPTFAMMALLIWVHGGSMPDMFCAAAQDESPLTGMVTMHLLMSALHLAPCLGLSYCAVLFTCRQREFGSCRRRPTGTSRDR